MKFYGWYSAKEAASNGGYVWVTPEGTHVIATTVCANTDDPPGDDYRYLGELIEPLGAVTAEFAMLEGSR